MVNRHSTNSTKMGSSTREVVTWSRKKLISRVYRDLSPIFDVLAFRWLQEFVFTVSLKTWDQYDHLYLLKAIQVKISLQLIQMLLSEKRNRSLFLICLEEIHSQIHEWKRYITSTYILSNDSAYTLNCKDEWIQVYLCKTTNIFLMLCMCADAKDNPQQEDTSTKFK